MLRNLMYLTPILFSVQFTFAQCKTGNCDTGNGEYDYGWCVYKGEFKDGKPNGTGTMKYDDYSYTGSFNNGVEDGQGVITYKNGKTEHVLFSKGTKVANGPSKVAIADWKEIKGTSAGCINGDCETGFGTFKFPGGNIYTGNFKNEARQGQGKFMFSNGDVIEGSFNDNAIVEGTYRFNNGCRFTGQWDSKGEMYSGTYYSPTGIPVKLVNGKVIQPEPEMVLPSNLPKGARIVYGDAAQAPVCEKWEVCSRCMGHKIISKPIVTTYSWTVGGSYSIDRYGNRHTDYESHSGGSTRTIPNYEVCDKCGGTGRTCAK